MRSRYPWTRCDQARKLFQRLGLNDRHRAKRDQAHHGANAEPRRRAIGQAEHVVEEPVLLVPHFVGGLPHAVHGPGDLEEVLHELQCEVLIAGIGRGQLDGELQHVLAEQRHPRRAVRLLQLTPRGQRRAAVEDPDVVEAEKSPFEQVATGRVFAVHPPREVDEQLLERVAEKVDVDSPVFMRRRTVREKRGPRMDRRVDVAEVPLVGRELAVRVQVDVARA